MQVLKHPALAVIPPNATISRAKNMSMALGVSMGMAGEVMAKVPAVLCMCSVNPGELNAELKPHVADVLEGWRCMSTLRGTGWGDRRGRRPRRSASPASTAREGKQ